MAKNIKFHRRQEILLNDQKQYIVVINKQINVIQTYPGFLDGGQGYTSENIVCI